jgi:hypothetical protein
MIKHKYLLIAVLLVFIVSLTAPINAEEKKKEDGTVFHGNFLVGYRGVDVSGTQDKYKEDYNLDTGARLFNFNVHFAPDGKLKKYFDRLEISMYNFGGDPFESFNLSIVKYGTYKFKYDRRKSNYFYKDIFAGHDLHTFDFDRVNDSAYLKVWLCNYAHFYFSFDRYTKKGDSTTSLDINRDEFEFDKPIDESSKEISIGMDVIFKGFSLYLEEKIRDYMNDYHFFIPGYDMGEDPSDMANLSYFFLNQPYDFRSFTHTGRMTARPFANLLIKAAASISSQDLRLSYSEEQGGTTYLGSPFAASYTGEGKFDRKVQLYDIDLTYLINNKVAFIGGVRYNNLEQEGTLTIYDTDMPQDLDFHTLGIEAGLQYQASGDLAVTAGFRSEKREVNTVEHGEMVEEDTKRTGMFGNIKWKLNKSLAFTGDYQFGSYEDPFTDISPTDFHRARFTAKYKAKSYYLNASYTYQLSENDIDELWKSERSQLNIRTGYHTKKVKLSLGYGLIYSKLEGDRNFVFYGQPLTWSIFTEGSTNMFDGYLYFLFDKKWSLGFYANWYKNNGYWEVERLILRPFLEVKFDGGFVGQVAYKYIDFKENVQGLNNYIANIFEISFGYRW